MEAFTQVLQASTCTILRVDASVYFSQQGAHGPHSGLYCNATSLYIYDLMGGPTVSDEEEESFQGQFTVQYNGSQSETNHCCTVPTGMALRNNRKRILPNGPNVKQCILCSPCLQTEDNLSKDLL